jgi:hypothetical protein
MLASVVLATFFDVVHVPPVGLQTLNVIDFLCMYYVTSCVSLLTLNVIDRFFSCMYVYLMCHLC